MQKAKRLLRRYKELRFLVQAHGRDGLPDSETRTYARGERLEAYLTQPLYVAETFTGTAGVTVSLQETLQDVQRIIDGGMDQIDVKKLLFIGRLQ
ncbi:hypothetical protein [Cohnella luojiensis]|uniref:ATP synthase A/B type C-terminal domain-containing protein n=1 Tax=Cohnella luojiensis TaxID=652876 RepID=A0A4Y8LX25_9BACL|nr:hypothetical protein [Cohnella luojiensis]TFE25840.1 hypothetical protein E2980_13065 [Cohnella luojiensis]